MLLQTIEERVKALNINILCVPLTYPAAIGFWERNGYSNVGTINWVADKEEKIACQFYKKSLSENVE